MDNPSDSDNTEQRLTKKGAIKNGQSRDPDNTEQRLTKKTQHRKLKKEQHGFYQQ